MEQAKKPIWKKILSIVFDVFLGFIIVVALGVSVYSLVSQADGGVPSIFGKSTLVVETESMTGTIDKGDLIFVDKFTDDDRAAEIAQLEPEQSVVTFRFDINGDGRKELVTHMYLGTTDVSGNQYYTFRGTYVAPGDSLDQLDIQMVPVSSADDIIGVWTGDRVPVLGSVLMFLRSPLGFGLIVVGPLLIFFIYSLIKLILALTEDTRNMRRKKVAVENLNLEDMDAEQLAKLQAMLKAKEEQEKQESVNKEND